MLIEYVSYVQDVDGVMMICCDCLIGKEFIVCFKYFVGVDGGNLLVVQYFGLFFEGKMGVVGLMNIIFKVDFSCYVVYCFLVFYWVLQLGLNVGGIGMGFVCMIWFWNEWLINWGYDIMQGVFDVDNVFVEGVVCDLIGDFDIDIEVMLVFIWMVNNCYVVCVYKGWVFCMGDVIYCYLLLNGFGLNMFI